MKRNKVIITNSKKKIIINKIKIAKKLITTIIIKKIVTRTITRNNRNNNHNHSNQQNQANTKTIKMIEMKFSGSRKNRKQMMAKTYFSQKG